MKTFPDCSPPALTADHLVLVFLASTLTPALRAGWAYSVTLTPQLPAAEVAAAPLVLRVAIVEQ